MNFKATLCNATLVNNLTFKNSDIKLDILLTCILSGYDCMHIDGYNMAVLIFSMFFFTSKFYLSIKKIFSTWINKLTLHSSAYDKQFLSNLICININNANFVKNITAIHILFNGDYLKLIYHSINGNTYSVNKKINFMSF